MKKRTRDILDCLLGLDDISLLEFYGYSPYRYKLVDKTAEIKTFQTFDDNKIISVRW